MILSYSLSLLLSQYLSCQASKFVGVYFLQRHDFWFKIEQELHICGEGQEIAIAAYVVVAKLDEMLHAVFLGMFPNGGDAFGLCCFGFHLYWHALAFESRRRRHPIVVYLLQHRELPFFFLIHVIQVRLGSESQRLLLLGKVKTFSHFVDERGGEIENEEGVDPVVER